MRGLVATGGPARSLRKETGVIDIADKDSSSHVLLLEMALQAERVVALVQHSLIDGAVRRVADDATLADCFVLKDKRTALRRMTLETGVIGAHERNPAALDRLVRARSAAFRRHSRMRIVAIGAAHFPFQHRMPMGQLKLRAHVEVTLETGVGRLLRINNRARPAAALDV